jgi:glycosyltransferase involved in cell wall biosynthesis
LVCSEPEDHEEIGPLSEICERVALVPFGYSGRHVRVRRVLDALGGPPGRPSSYVPANLEGYLKSAHELSAAGGFDVAIGELGFAPMVVAAGATATILDNDDVLDDQYRQLWRIEPWGWGKLTLLRRWRALRRFERKWLPRPDALTVCSHRDRALMHGSHRSLPPVRVVPNGVDLGSDGFSADSRDPNMLIMAGIMGWPPNAHGARFLARRVMPRVWSERPTARLWLVGRDPRADVSSLAGDRVIVTGRVPDVGPYRRRAAVEVVPLFAGGGTRLKILQAMAAGTPVVSTAVGASGLELLAGEEVCIADGPDDMATAILQLLDDRSRAATLARTARRRVEADFGWDAIGSELAELIEEVASRAVGNSRGRTSSVAGSSGAGPS